MNTRLKQHDKVKLLVDPDPEYIEYDTEVESQGQHPEIKKGMLGEINMILPNGQYHVKVFNSEGKEIAYVPMDEQFLEQIE